MESSGHAVLTRVKVGSTRRPPRGRSLVLALGAFLLAAVIVAIVPGGAGASTAWPSVSQAAQVFGPVNAQITGVQFLSCPTATECVAIGLSAGNSDGVLPWIGTLAGGSWTFVNGSVPADASSVNAGVQMTGLSCASVTSCVAVGTYIDNDSVQRGLLLTMTGGIWEAVDAPLPTNAATDGQVDVRAVSCSTDGDCTAIGRYMLATNKFSALSLELSYGTWTAVQAANLSDDLTTISCDPTGICVAAGDYVPTGSFYDAVQLATNAGGTWSAVEAPLPSWTGFDAEPVSSVSAVACPATNACTAVGNWDDPNGSQALVLQQSADGWTATSVPIPGEATAVPPPGVANNPWVSINALACPAVGSCVADGTYQDGARDTFGALLQETPQGWTAQQAPVPPDASAGNPFVSLGAGSLSCPEAGQCTAVGSYETQSSLNTQIGDAGMVVTQSNGSWVFATQQAWPSGYVPGQPDSVVSSYLLGVSCASAENCWAYGYLGKDDPDTGNVSQWDLDSIATTRPSVGTTAPTITLKPANAIAIDDQATSVAATITGNASGGNPTDPVSFYLCDPTATPTPCTTYSNPLGEVDPTPASDDTSTAISPTFGESESGYWCAAAYYYGDSNYGAATDVTTDGCFDVPPTITSPDTTSFTEGSNATPFDVTAGPDAASVGFAKTGLLPSGVSLSTAGVLAGTPAASGNFPITITATDSTGHSATQSFVLSVTPSSTTSLQIETSSPLAAAQAKAPYSVTLSASGGSSPYKWKLISSALPKGLRLNKATGTISGKPKPHALGTDSFEVQVSSGSEKAVASFSITVS